MDWELYIDTPGHPCIWAQILVILGELTGHRVATKKKGEDHIENHRKGGTSEIELCRVRSLATSRWEWHELGP